MVIYLHEKFYQSNATQLSESDIKEIRESRGKISNASKKMAEKFHIGARCVYEIWNNSEHLQQGLILSSSDQLALDKTEQTLKVVSEVSSISFPATEIPKKNG
ncbi:7897_t:CDS:1 [Funneliformis geosporum]|uniref:7897_t:CDS:1 n=1 Tax=Funneliformis geosporum TaxID=1117311 RepID=A0A9W4SQW5_9GLOM|nr:7897_t:CDS:1 [Funneliformis geosporum]